MLAQLLTLIDRVYSGVTTAQRLLAFWGPITDVPGLVGPLLAIASVLVLAMLTGVAVGSLATLIVAMMLLYVLLTDVFGVTIDLA